MAQHLHILMPSMHGLTTIKMLPMAMLNVHTSVHYIFQNTSLLFFFCMHDRLYMVCVQYECFHIADIDIISKVYTVANEDFRHKTLRRH